MILAEWQQRAYTEKSDIPSSERSVFKTDLFGPGLWQMYVQVGKEPTLRKSMAVLFMVVRTLE